MSGSEEPPDGTWKRDIPLPAPFSVGFAKSRCGVEGDGCLEGMVGTRFFAQ